MHKFHPSILRAYDIRGVVDKTLNKQDAYNIGRAFSAVLFEQNKINIVVGYDGRLSSIDLKESLINGLLDSGINVTEIGLCPTPMLYFAVHSLNKEAGIMITGSHNPPNYNGFKFMIKNQSFYGEDILKLGTIAESANFVNGNGKIEYVSMMENYVNYLSEDCTIKSGGEFLDEVDDFFENKKKLLKISWDNGNGSSGQVLQKLVKQIKAQSFLLFEEIDGNFPNHHPDPTIEENLVDLKQSVLTNNCDLGIAFDGDGDRIGVVDDCGEVLWGDQLMCLFAQDVLRERPGSTIIADVKASQVLFDEIEKFGGKPLMWKTGHSLIKAKMKETNSPLAGEMSGHIFFADKYFGFDDGIYAAIRLINIIVKEGKPLSEIKKNLTKTFSTPEIKISCAEEKKFLLIEQVAKQLQKENIEFNNIDGIRLTNTFGWWLLRASNTSPFLIARCESISAQNLQELKKDLAHRLTILNIFPPEILLS